MQIFTDADCSRSIEDKRSTTGYCTYVWENFVTWKNKKQNLAARRSAKPDFSALLHKEWVTDYGQKSFWEKLRITRELPVKLYYNKNVAISTSLNPVQHDRTKNVEVDRHFFKEKVENGIICLQRSKQLTSSLKVYPIRISMILLASWTWLISTIQL